MGKKSQRKQIGKEWTKATPDEVISGGPIRIERYGRFLRFLNTSTPEEHADFLKRAEEENKRTLEDIAREIGALQRLVGKYDPVEIMHRATYVLLPLFIKYKSENEFGPDESYYLPAVEYLQYLLARTPASTDVKKPSEEEWKEIWGKAMEVLRLTGHYLFTRKTLEKPPSEIDELRFLLDSMRLGVRVRRYPIFLADHLKMSLMPYEKWIRNIYGVGVEEIVEGLMKIDEYQKTGVVGRYRDVTDLEKIFSQKLRERGFRVDRGASPEELERTRHAVVSEEFRELHDEMQEKLRLTFTPAIFDISDLTSLPKSFLSLLSVKPGESVLTTLTGPNHDDLSPLSPSILHYKPFLEAEGRFYTFYHSGFEDRIAEIIEADLFQRFQGRPDQISEMAKRRSDRIESESKDLLGSIIKPDSIFQNVYYPNPDKVGDLTELDILFTVDDIVFLVEVKAGGLSDSASRGAPKSLAKELSDLIIEGQHQSERAEKYIKSNEEVAFFDQTGRNVIHTIRQSAVRRVFRIVITREELGWVGAKIAILSILDPNLSKSFPWHVSIDDLRVVAELFRDNEIRFVHFLEQRLKASAETRISQHDEIEHIGLYNKMNYYHEMPLKGDFDLISYDASFMRDIDSYFVERAEGRSPAVPTQDMPPKMRDFINALRDCRLPGRFEVGSIILSMDGAGRAEFQRGLNTLDAGRAEGRQLTLRLPFTKLSFGLTVTYVDEAHWRDELLRSAAQMELGECSRWLVVKFANISSYSVSKIETILAGRFSDTELAPAKTHLEEVASRTIAAEKTGRNAPCPCGSGKKYKKCHGRS